MSRTAHLLRTSFPVSLLFLVLTLTVGLFSGLSFEQEHLRRVGRGFYSDRAVFFRMPDMTLRETDPLTAALLPDAGTDYLLMGAADDLRLVGYRGDPELPPLREGRFLSETECRDGARVAVIGSDRVAEAERREEELFWSVGSERFRVVGVMGTPDPGPLNQVVLVPVAAVPPEFLSALRFFVDGPQPGQVLSEIGTGLRSLGLSEPVPLPVPPDPTDLIALRTDRAGLYLTLMLGVLTLSAVVLLTSWIRARRYRTAVLRLVGYAPAILFVRLLAEFLLLAAVGVGLAVLTQITLQSLGLYRGYTGLLRESVIVALKTLVLGLAICIPAWVVQLHRDVVRELRTEGGAS